MAPTAALVLLATAAAAPAFKVSLIEQPSPLVSFPTSTAFQQSQNPSYVPRSVHLPDGGLMVRLQNCSGSKFPNKGPTNQTGCNYGNGSAAADCYGDSGFVRDHIAFLPFPKGYTGDKAPTGLPRITPAQIVFQPQPGLADEKWGTQDPQCAFDPYTSSYFLSYTAWAGPSAGWGQKAATSQTPGTPSSWKRLGPTFTPNNSAPTMPKGTESNIKCSALYANPDAKASPRYYLYSGDVTPHGARVSSSDSIEGPWSARALVTGGDIVKGAWDDHMGCNTPPIALTGDGLEGHLLTFYNAYPPVFPGKPGFQVGWMILNGSDPTTAIARSKTPVLATAGIKWMDGSPGLYCNDPYVVFMQSPPQPVTGQPNTFRLYFGMGGSYVGTAKVKVTLE